MPDTTPRAPRQVWRSIRGSNANYKVAYYNSKESRDKAAAKWAQKDGQRVILDCWSADHPQDELNAGWASDGAADPVVMVTVHMENTYSDGHESDNFVDVPAPTNSDEETLDSWWEDTVYEHTGDGHGTARGIESHYQATIVKAADEAMVGLTREWC